MLAACIIQQWNVAGVAERLQQVDGGVKGLFQFTLKAINDLSWCLHFWKTKVLAQHVLFKIGEDIIPCSAYHNMFQNTIANLTGDLFDSLFVFRIGAVNSIKSFSKSLEIFFKVRNTRNRRIFRCLKEFELGKNIVDGVIHWSSGNENNLFSTADIKQIGV